MRSIVFSIVIGCLITITCSAFGASSPSPHVGYVDVKEVLSRSRWGGEVEREVKRQKDKLHNALVEKGNIFKEKKDQFEKKKAILDQKEKKKQSAELQRMEQEINEMYKKSQTQYVQLQEKLFAPLFGKLREVIQQVANKDHYDYVLNKAVIMYDSGKDDLTNRVLVELNNATPINPLNQ